MIIENISIPDIKSGCKPAQGVRRLKHVTMVVLLYLPLQAALAADAYWIGGSSWWDFGENWSTGFQPMDGDDVYLTQLDATNRTVYYFNVIYPNAELSSLTIDATGTGQMTLLQSDTYPDPLKVTLEFIGDYGTGAFTQTGGSHTVTDHLYLGSESTGYGTYDLSGGYLTTSWERIGDYGIGVFTHTGGTHSVTTDLTLGETNTSHGTYYLSGAGNLEATRVTISDRGVGVFIQDGGTHTVTTNLVLAESAGNEGSYDLSGTGSLETVNEVIGNNGIGTFTQSGGIHTVTGNLDLGGTGTSSDTGSGTYNLSGGSLNVGTETIGFANDGTFTQSDGNHTVIGNLYLGYETGGWGTYTLAGGILSAGAIATGAGWGELTIDGGTLTVGGGTGSIEVDSLWLGSVDGTNGSYNLSGGSVMTAGERIGQGGTGTFIHTGGTHNVTNNLYLGFLSTGIGFYNLSGTGSLEAANEYIGYAGAGTFTQTGGTHTVTDTLTLGRVDTVSDGGTYELSGAGSLSAGNVVIGDEGLGLFTQHGGTHTVTGHLDLGSMHSTGNGTYELNDGSLTALTETIGGFGTGNFIQTGGTHTVTDTLTLGHLFYADVSGTYNLSNGNLETVNEFVGDSGWAIFNQTGGAHTVTGTLRVGSGSDTYTNGTYNLSGTGSLVTDNVFVGDTGLGKFNQTGGTHTVTGRLEIGNTSTGRGTYTVSDDAYLTAEELYIGNGTGVLNILNGGSVSSSESWISYDGNATITVDGNNSTWQTTNYLAVGVFGNASLNIKNGGSVSSTSSIVGYFGTGTVTVDGAGSIFANSDFLHLGSNGTGTGTLHVLNGGSVSNIDAYLGFEGGNSGTATVSSGGNWANTGSLYIGGGDTAAGGSGELNVGTGGSVDITNTLKLWNGGSVNLSGGTINTGNVNAGLGTFNFTAGTLNVYGNLLTSDLADNITLNRPKTLSVFGTTTLDGASVFTLDGGTFSTDSLIDNGVFAFNSGTFNLTSDDLTIGSSGLFGRRAVFEYGQEVNVTNDVFIEPGATLSMRGGIITAGGISNDGVIEMADPLSELGGALLLNNGLLYGSGTINSYFFHFINGLSGEIRADLGETLTFTGSAVDNPGRITLLGGALDFTQGLNNDGQVSGRGTIIVGPAASLVNSDRMAFSGTTDIIGDVNNATGGSIIISGSSTATFHDNVTHNGSEIRVSEGSMAVFFGNVTGTGPYTGDGTVFYEGNLYPGSSPGLVSIEGDMGLGVASHTIMEIAGLERGSEYDAFDIGDSLWLDGELEVSLYDLGDGLFIPQLGDSFDLFAAETISGEFDLLTLAFLGNGLGWQLDVVADAMGLTDVVRLSVVTSAVPVPPSVWLFGSGLLGLIAVSRQRRAA